MRTAVVLGVVAGCGGGPAASTTPVDNQGAPPRVQVVPCPGSEELVADLRRLQSTTPAQADVTIDDCQPGTFGPAGAGWAIAARAESDDLDATRFVFVLDTAHAMIAAIPGEPIDFRSDGSPVALELFDLDHDGVDEVLAQAAHHEGGVDENYLSVLVITGDHLTSAGELVLGYDDTITKDPSAVQCSASFEVTPAGLVTSTLLSFGEPNESCQPGEVVWTLSGGHLSKSD